MVLFCSLICVACGIAIVFFILMCNPLFDVFLYFFIVVVGVMNNFIIRVLHV